MVQRFEVKTGDRLLLYREQEYHQIADFKKLRSRTSRTRLTSVRLTSVRHILPFFYGAFALFPQLLYPSLALSQPTNPPSKSAAVAAAPSLEDLRREEEELRKQEESLLLAARGKQADAIGNTEGKPAISITPVNLPKKETPADKSKPTLSNQQRQPATIQNRAAAQKVTKTSAQSPASTGTRPVSSPPAPKNIRDPRDVELTLLRERVAALTTRNRQVEAELEAAQRQLVTSETEVERLNEFLNDQGRAYLDRASGSPSDGRPSPPRRAPNSEGEYNPTSRRAPSNIDQISGSRPSPAGALQADRDAPIATIIAASAAGREEPSSSAAVIETLPESSRVAVERRSGDWYRVLSPQGIRVWIAAKDLSFNASGGPSLVDKGNGQGAPSILPPQKGQTAQRDGSSQQGRAEDRALELLRQSIGKRN
jgi:hypothetical protein